MWTFQRFYYHPISPFDLFEFIVASKIKLKGGDHQLQMDFKKMNNDSIYFSFSILLLYYSMIENEMRFVSNGLQFNGVDIGWISYPESIPIHCITYRPSITYQKQV